MSFQQHELSISLSFQQHELSISKALNQHDLSCFQQHELRFYLRTNLLNRQTCFQQHELRFYLLLLFNTVYPFTLIFTVYLFTDHLRLPSLTIYYIEL